MYVDTSVCVAPNMFPMQTFHSPLCVCTHVERLVVDCRRLGTKQLVILSMYDAVTKFIHVLYMCVCVLQHRNAEDSAFSSAFLCCNMCV
jgi:hypothetical protein